VRHVGYYQELAFCSLYSNWYHRIVGIWRGDHRV